MARKKIFTDGTKYAKGGGLPNYFFEGGKNVNLIKYSVDNQIFRQYENYQDAIEDFNKLKSNHNVTLLKFDNEGRGESKTIKQSDLARKKIFTDGTKYAKGGLTEHGLRLGDKIVGKGIRTIKVEDSENKKHIVNLNTGTREDSFKKGGNISSMLRNRRGI